MCENYFDETCSEVSLDCRKNWKTYFRFLLDHHRVGGDQPSINTFHKTLLKAFKKFSLSTSLILTRWAVIAGSWVFWNREAQRSSWVFQLYKSKPLSLSVLFVVKTLAIEFAIINIFLVLITRKRYNITVCFPPRYLLRRLPICWRSNQEGQPPTH